MEKERDTLNQEKGIIQAEVLRLQGEVDNLNKQMENTKVVSIHLLSNLKHVLHVAFSGSSIVSS